MDLGVTPADRSVFNVNFALWVTAKNDRLVSQLESLVDNRWVGGS